MAIIVTGTYVSLTLVQKEVYIYWTLYQAQLGKTFEQKNVQTVVLFPSVCTQ